MVNPAAILGVPGVFRNQVPSGRIIVILDRRKASALLSAQAAGVLDMPQGRPVDPTELDTFSSF